MILALDIATRMGWALGAPGTVPSTGSVTFGSNDASNGARFHHAAQWAVKMFNENDVDILTIEDQLSPQAFKHRQAAKLLYGFPAVIKERAYERGIYDVERSVADVRGLFIRRRHLKSADAKAAVMRRCRQLGWDVCDHNAADACALWAYECSLLKGATIVHDLARCGL
jgi:hypothetical protein